jgi:AcrR family transcriptional regulator
MTNGLEVPMASMSAAPYRKLRRGRRKAGGLSEEQVAAHQRMRMYAAMIELAGARGYAATTTAELSRLAAMSKRDMYKRFPSKEAYFLATYDFVVHRAVRRLADVYAGEGHWRERLRRAFLEFAELVAEEPQAARLVLVEVLAVGPAAVGRMERTRVIFERILDASFAQAPDGVVLPAPLSKGIVCGVERIVRQRLLGGGIEELPALAEELLAWACSYRSVAVARLPDTHAVDPGYQTVRQPQVEARNEHARILRAVATLAALNGYTRLTSEQIVARAQVSSETFHAAYPSIEQCFLDALERMALEALVCAGEAARATDDRLTGVHRGIAALMDHIADDPILRKVAFVEVFSVGSAGIDRREVLLHQFTDLFADIVPPTERPSELVAEAIVGAIWGLVHHYVVHGASWQLPSMTNAATYLALAPLVGGKRAVKTILKGSH